MANTIQAALAALLVFVGCSLALLLAGISLLPPDLGEVRAAGAFAGLGGVALVLAIVAFRAVGRRSGRNDIRPA